MPLSHTQLVILVSEFIIGFPTPPHLNEDRNILCVLAHMPPCHIKNTGSHLYNLSVSPINSLSAGARQQMGKNVLSTASLSLKTVAAIVSGLKTVGFLWKLVDHIACFRGRLFSTAALTSDEDTEKLLGHLLVYRLFACYSLHTAIFVCSDTQLIQEYSHQTSCTLNPKEGFVAVLKLNKRYSNRAGSPISSI